MTWPNFEVWVKCVKGLIIQLTIYHTCFSVCEAESRRPSLVSALSNAYTVKSLPGAMLYIPLDSEYNTPIALKRSLSDPEIYFPSAVKHSLIVAVNGLLSSTARSGGGGAGGISGDRRSTSGLPVAALNGSVIGGGGEKSGGGGLGAASVNGGTGSIVVAAAHHHKEKAMSAKTIRPPSRREETLQIDINVIQPTPNISPTCSIRDATCLMIFKK